MTTRVPDSGREGATIEERGETLAELIVAADPRHAALVAPDEDRVLSYAELVAATEKLAGAISALGVERGDRVAVVVTDGPHLVLVLLALAALGATGMPLNPAYTEQEYSFYLSDLMPSLLLVAEGLGAVERAAPEIRTARVADTDGQLVPSLSVNGRDAETTRSFDGAEPSDILLLLHTSGTTNRPKQVPLRHANVVASARTIAGHYGLTEADVSYCVMPLFHVHGLVASAFSCFAAGGTAVVPRRFTPRAFWAHLPAHGVTWFSASPTLHQMILERRGETAIPATLRFLRSCSAPLSPHLMETAEATYEVAMLEAYGMTEASHQISSNPLPPEPRLPGTVGLPTGTRVRIVDSSGDDVPEGSLGEVVIAGPGVTSGYLNNPEATAESFVGEWFRTGDQARLDRGYIKLEGRLKEMILRGGENISPYEVESVLLRHTAVKHAACFGLPDEKYGERVLAAVELAGPTTERDLVRHCRESLASFKVPERVYFVDSLPRTATGKVQRSKISALVGEDGG